MKTWIKQLGIILATVFCGIIAERFDIWNEVILCWIITVYVELVWSDF